MKCDKKDLLLYAVTDRHWLEGRKLIDVVKESLDGGVTMVQLREKTLEEGKFLEEARELQALCRERHIPFIVNDNVDIAKAMDADGVHVGQSDMEALDVRAKLGPDKIIGVLLTLIKNTSVPRWRTSASKSRLSWPFCLACPVMMCTDEVKSRCVTGMPAYAGTDSALVTPGTTSNGIWCCSSSSNSSPPRPNKKQSPPLRRTTRLPSCAFSSKISLMRHCGTG